MFTKTKILGAAIALALAATVAQADTVRIDPDGAAPGDGTLQVGSLDWATGNSIAIGAGGAGFAVGSTFQVYAHGRLNAFQDPDGNGIGGTGLNSDYEWTFVAGFRETIVSIDPATGTATFVVTPGPENFFRIYYDDTPDASNLAGTGFNNGTLIADGTGSTGSGTFGRSVVSPGGPGNPLDACGANNYPAISSINGTGGTRLSGLIRFTDPSFFLAPPTIFDFAFDSQQNLNLRQTNPSALFTNAANATVVPGATVASVGTCNGCLVIEGGGPNIVFETDASSTFSTLVPEPNSLALLGLGLFALGAVARRSRKS